MTQRIFVALPISDQVKWELERAQEELRKKNQHLRVTWSDPKLAHITLVFMGEIGESELEKTKEILKLQTSQQLSFEFLLQNIDAFPNIFHAKTIIVRAKDIGQKCTVFQRKLLNALVNAGLPTDLKIWHPHLTLGRKKSEGNIKGLQDVSIEKINWGVKEVLLVASELKETGPVHSVLEKYKLDIKVGDGVKKRSKHAKIKTIRTNFP